jgi:hypothetical protein
MHADPIQTLIDKLHDLPPERFAEVEGFVDFLRSRTRTKDTSAAHRVPLDFPVDHPGGPCRPVAGSFELVCAQ